MRSTVIHHPPRLDRAKHVAALHALLPGIVLTYAQAPEGEADPFNRAVRGCSLSHLLAVTELLTPDSGGLLVLEDDAVPYEPGLPGLSTVAADAPADAGIVLFGAETEQHGPKLENGYREVLPRYWGTHAVWYSPKLLSTPFLTNAYRVLASRAIGRNASVNGLCYESVLFLALIGTGLKIYRPATLAFTADSTERSERTGEPMAARTSNLTLD